MVIGQDTCAGFTQAVERGIILLSGRPEFTFLDLITPTYPTHSSSSKLFRPPLPVASDRPGGQEHNRQILLVLSAQVTPQTTLVPIHASTIYHNPAEISRQSGRRQLDTSSRSRNTLSALGACQAFCFHPSCQLLSPNSSPTSSLRSTARPSLPPFDLFPPP